MTTWEAWISGMVWGSLSRMEKGFVVTCPSYRAEHATRGEIIVRGSDGTELLITVTQTREPTPP